MANEDEEKTTFIIDEETFCFKVMPFGLQNVEVMFQRLMNRIFKNQIERSLEAYVDDILVRLKKKGDHVGDLRETFGNIWTASMCLKAKKCTLGSKRYNSSSMT